MAFIVVEDFVTSYLDHFEKEGKELTKAELTNVFAHMKNRYTQLTYKDVLEQVQKMFST